MSVRIGSVDFGTPADVALTGDAGVGKHGEVAATVRVLTTGTIAIPVAVRGSTIQVKVVQGLLFGTVR